MSTQLDRILEIGRFGYTDELARDAGLAPASFNMSVFTAGIQACLLVVTITSPCYLSPVWSQLLGLVHAVSVAMAAATVIVAIIALAAGSRPRKSASLGLGIGIASTVLFYVILIVHFLFTFSF
jgi:hypothetical protein